MKRNTKFLLALLVSMSALVGLGMLTGCGDDTTTIAGNPPESQDSVVGTGQGQVQDAWDGTPLEGVWVYWTHRGVKDSAETDARGYWTTGPTLSPGDFNFTFQYTGYASALEEGTIRTVDQLAEDPNGGYYDEAVVDVDMYPMDGGLQGRLYEALPTGAPKEGDLEFRLDDPNLLGVVSGVTVTLDYSEFNIVPNKYTTTTDENGLFSFTNVPAAINEDWDGDGTTDRVKLTTAAFESGGQTYGSTTYDETTGLPDLTSGMTVAVPNIYAPVQGEAQLDLTFAPVVLEYNFIGGSFGVTNSIELEFSDAMDPDQTVITFKDGPLVGGVPSGAAVAFTETWAADYKSVTVDPVAPLSAGETYSINVTGKSADGRTLVDSDASANFNRNLYTQAGIELLSANFVEFGAGVTNFELDANIWLVFDMTPDTTVDGTLVRLLDQTDGGTVVEITWTNPGDTIKIDPVEPLFSNHEYKVDFKIYSSLPGDFATDDDDLTGITFETVSTVAVPGAVTNFALNYVGTKKFDFDDTQVKFKWDPVTDADYYEIYAKNNKSVTNFIPVDTANEHADHLTSQVSTVDFTDDANYPTIVNFDIYDADAITTPFTNGTQVTFKCRAVNSAGAGPWSNEITVADEVKPTPAVTTAVPTVAVDEEMNTAYVAEGYAQGNAVKGQDIGADATSSDTAYTVRVWFDDMEYLADNVTFSFIEGGGDPTYVLPTAAATWNWLEASTRDGYAEITVPAGKMAAVDTMAVTFTDNSGNDTTIYHQLLPVLTITAPLDTTSNFHPKAGADDFTMEWTSTNHDFDDGNQLAGGTDLDLFWSVDGGTTWHDTLTDNTDLAAWTTVGAGSKVIELAADDDTIRTATAKLGLKKNGCDDCFRYTTENFVWGGLKWTIPTADSTAIVSDDSTYYDAGGFTSSTVPLTFEVIGLDSVIIQLDDGVAAQYHSDTIYIDDWTVLDTITVNWTPEISPNAEAGYTATLALQKAAGAAQNYEPREALPWTFDVEHDYMKITNPDADMVAGGEAFTGGTGIVWTYVGPDASKAALWYIPDGTNADSDNWTDSVLIDTVTLSDGNYDEWTPPANAPSDNKARILAIDMAGDSAHASPLFTVSGLTITTPAADILRGDATNVVIGEVGGAGLSGAVYYSCDNFTSDSVEVDDDAGGASPWAWSAAIQTTDATVCQPCDTARLRIWGSTDTKTYATTDAFAYEGYIVTGPDSSNADLFIDSSVTITWTTVGDAEHDALNVDLFYTQNGGPFDPLNAGDWTAITTNIPNTGTFTYSISNNQSWYSNTVRFAVAATGEASNLCAGDTLEVVSVKITKPVAGDVSGYDNNGAHDIEWSLYGKHYDWSAASLIFEFSQNSGATWAQVSGAAAVDADLGTFSWDLSAQTDVDAGAAPADAGATYQLRVRKTDGTTWFYSPIFEVVE